MQQVCYPTKTVSIFREYLMASFAHRGHGDKVGHRMWHQPSFHVQIASAVANYNAQEVKDG